MLHTGRSMDNVLSTSSSWVWRSRLHRDQCTNLFVGHDTKCITRYRATSPLRTEEYIWYLYEKLQELMKSTLLTPVIAINDFFTTYWTALQYAAGQAGLVVQQLVDELDPAKPTTFSWINVVSVLAFGLAFLGAPTIAVGILTMEATNQIKYAAQALLISVSQTPGLAKAFWPSGTDDSKMVQIGQLDKQLGNATQEMANMMNTAVERIMSDMPTFVAFAENGRFSSNQSLSLPSKTDGLNYALTTYLLSETMNKNGWYTSPFLGPYPNAAAVESSTYPGFSCKMGPNNICTMYGDDAEYWSQSTQRVYALTNIKPNDKTRSPLQLTTDIVQNSWAALDVLFDGAYNCTADGKAGSAAINFNLDGTLDIACISQLPVKIPCGVTCYVPLINGQCPFGRTTTGC